MDTDTTEDSVLFTFFKAPGQQLFPGWSFVICSLFACLVLFCSFFSVRPFLLALSRSLFFFFFF